MTDHALGLSEIIDYVAVEQGTAWVEFKCRRARIRWDAKVNSDWLDPSIITKYDSLLKESCSPVRIYSNHSDYGQAAFLTAFTRDNKSKFDEMCAIDLPPIETPTVVCSVNTEALSYLQAIDTSKLADCETESETGNRMKISEFLASLGLSRESDGVYRRWSSDQKVCCAATIGPTPLGKTRVDMGFVCPQILELFGFDPYETIFPGHGECGIRLMFTDSIRPQQTVDTTRIMSQTLHPESEFGTFESFFQSVAEIDGWPDYFSEQLLNMPGQDTFWYSMLNYSLFFQEELDLQRCHEVLQLHQNCRRPMSVHVDRQMEWLSQRCD